MKTRLFCALCALPLLCFADGLPDLGDTSQALIPPQQERAIGEQIMQEVRADGSYLDDPEVNDYLNQLGYQLAANSTEPSLGFEFAAINDSAINAFSLPGGFIFVNTGLILLTQSESELASVLGHEIAHATQHHVIRMIAGQKIDSLAALASLALAILAARSNPDMAQAAIIGSQAASIQRQLNFSRDNEREADRLGLTVLQKSGFDAYAMPAFLQRMQKASRLFDSGAVPSYLRTHPVTSERVSDIANRVQNTKFKLVESSLSYYLVRAKIQATQKTRREALAYFDDAVATQKGNQIAQRYGLTLALLRNDQPQRAAETFEPLKNMVTQNPMIATLAGEVRRKNGDDNAELTAFYRSALQNFPQHRALVYNYVDLLLDTGRNADALKLLNTQILAHPDDADLYDRQARTYAAMGDRQREHHALSHAYALIGALNEAVLQLELAKRAGKDFYQLSEIESELKQYREILDALKEEQGK
ncbi:MAG: M48 family metalloprotease [Gallionellaceae bacterium]|jgi:predicted Zn-dependent protease|nr:M48 family metalloprotease [Gallionellaceae bacterium]